MEKKKKFNIIWNSKENELWGKGYYIIYENYKGEPTFDSKYGIYEYSKEVDMVSVGILNKINHLYDMGYVYDRYYAKNIDLKNIF